MRRVHSIPLTQAPAASPWSTCICTYPQGILGALYISMIHQHGNAVLSASGCQTWCLHPCTLCNVVNTETAVVVYSVSALRDLALVLQCLHQNRSALPFCRPLKCTAAFQLQTAMASRLLNTGSNDYLRAHRLVSARILTTSRTLLLDPFCQCNHGPSHFAPPQLALSVARARVALILLLPLS